MRQQLMFGARTCHGRQWRARCASGSRPRGGNTNRERRVDRGRTLEAKQQHVKTMPRLLAARSLIAAALVFVFVASAAGDTLDPPARSGGSNFKEGCSSAPAGPTPSDETANLSDQLAQSNGVICPPAGVDPKMAAPPRQGGATPVIPPPGAPGGDPNTIPK